MPRKESGVKLDFENFITKAENEEKINKPKDYFAQKEKLQTNYLSNLAEMNQKHEAKLSMGELEHKKDIFETLAPLSCLPNIIPLKKARNQTEKSYEFSVDLMNTKKSLNNIISNCQSLLDATELDQRVYLENTQKFIQASNNHINQKICTIQNLLNYTK